MHMHMHMHVRSTQARTRARTCVPDALRHVELVAKHGDAQHAQAALSPGAAEQHRLVRAVDPAVRDEDAHARVQHHFVLRGHPRTHRQRRARAARTQRGEVCSFWVFLWGVSRVIFSKSHREASKKK